MHPLIKKLEQHFGLQAFRGRQEAVINHVLQGHHALVIMPTGMGKSLCYQLPALCFDELTIVISPLIALMKDQVDALKRRGIDAAFINSTLRRKEREQRYAEVAEGRYRLLYVTPERFRKPEFASLVAQRPVALLAVDEAHCISTWGHDFRPDYTRIGDFRALLGNPTSIALTATATPEVQKDIVRQLGLSPDAMKVFHEGIARPNLHLEVEDVWGEDQKQPFVLAALQQGAASGIVYFSLIKTLRAFSDWLTRKKARHHVYHGDLDKRVRKRVQNQFMQDPHAVVLATNAFGMGIDKENIRFVMHAEVPGSLEAYYQEIGRAGRDGEGATCTLLYDEQDLLIQMDFIKWNNPGAAFYVRLYNALQEDIERVNAYGLEILKDKLLFKSKHDYRLETALGILERHAVIEGELERKNLRVISDLPSALQDQELLDEKRIREQKKLYTLVEYAKTGEDRKAFIHRYFGIPYSG